MRTLVLFTLVSASAIAQTIAIESVNVVPMDRARVVSKQTVIVKDGRIAEIGAAGRVRVPDGATRVDGANKYLVPGFAEMHGHLPGPGTPPQVTENILFLYVANGVTTVRGMLGHPSHLEMRKRIEDGAVLGPKLYVAGPALSGQTAKSVDVARQMVRDQKAAGYDHLKIQEGLGREVYDAIVATANEVRIPFGGHVPNDVGVHRAIEARQISIDHLDNYVEGIEADNSPLKDADPQRRARELPFHLDERKIEPLAKKTRDAGIWMVPTMALWETFNSTDTPESLAARPEMKYMPKSMVEQWAAAKQKMLASVEPKGGARILEVRKKILRALYDAGAPIAFGTDSPQIFSVPGFSIHREAPIMVACGMKPYDVLRSLTRNVAEYFGTLNDSGTVQPGKRADLVLLEADPLKDVAALSKRAGVFVRGRWLPESDIQSRLKALAK
jgi:imidazolonepropionase-like amidohydrolase